jgi:glycosyltransferase involved in cell wall biosynthesis
MANNTYCPYFIWFAEKSRSAPDLELTFILLTDVRPTMIEELEEYGCACYWIPFNSENRSRAMLEALYPLYKLFKRIKPDIVHSHLFDDSVPALLAARIAGIDVRVVTKQDSFFHWTFKPSKVKFDRFNNFNSTHILAISEEVKEFVIEKEGVTTEKVTLVHNGLYPDNTGDITKVEKENMRRQLKLNDKIVITTVARYIEWKGYKLIINAAEAIVKEFPNARFIFVGYGDQKEELEKLVELKGLKEYVNITGLMPRHDVTVLYTISDIYLHAALNEPFGFVIAEAMMYGVPVISTNTGAARDAIKHKGNGFLIYDRTSEKIAQTVLEVLQMDDYKSIGEKGRKTAREMYHFDVMWENYIALYKQVLNLS